MEELLRKKGHSVLIFSTRDTRNKESRESPFFIEKIDYNSPNIPLRQKIKFGLRLLYSFDAARKIDALLRKDRPDIAHLHNICHQISPSILPVLKKHGVPIVHTLHDLKLICPNHQMLSPNGICEKCKWSRYYHAVLQRCVKGSLAFGALNCLEAYFHKAMGIYSLVDIYISPSTFLKQKLMSFGVDGRRIRVLPNFVVPDASPSTTSGGYILYCGRLGSEKGLLTLIRAVQDSSHVRLIIAGSGQEELPIRQYLIKNRMKNVQLAGFVAGEARTQLMQKASFFVLPSELYENCPLLVLEAFAHGRPVVAARIGGIPEQVRDGFNGLLFEPGNVQDLRDKIRYLVSRPQEIIRMGRNARRTAEETYSPEAHYRKLMQIYQDAIAWRLWKKAGTAGSFSSGGEGHP